MNGVKANSGVWMENTRFWEPMIRQTLHPCPIQVMPLATMNQHRPPEPHQPIAESMQAVGVSRYRMVVEVTNDLKRIPCRAKSLSYLQSACPVDSVYGHDHEQSDQWQPKVASNIDPTASRWMICHRQ